MRLVNRAVSGALTAALAVGIVTVPAVVADASTHTATKSASGVTVAVSVLDVPNKAGKYTVSNWAKVSVSIPAAFKDSNGKSVPVSYSVELRTVGDATCGGSTGTTVLYKYSQTKSATWTLPLTLDNTKRSGISHYTQSGQCSLHAEVEAYRYTVANGGDLDATVTTAATFGVRSASSLSKPVASPTRVVRNHTTKITGTGTYTRVDQSHYYTRSYLPAGSKLSFQYHAAGSSTWRYGGTIVVGSSGRWTKAVKVTGTTFYRVVYAGTRTVAGYSSLATSVGAY
ncbi:hypothetical protein [Luteimicrobium subarcticum]|uniref:Uncharacterized protein n=1 Tax=Luteimicrobium subarcticum TaxID=620910 RepID=A0A2M8W431_9MICO|nr:hypothetical protein [Luteimicrobium subarcticum]PJI85670.1 hypothetical protein CLV34_2859 [Luteimicrobium subarcticum]